MIPRSVQLLGIALGIGGLFVTAYMMIMTTFMVYDDEGFVLISLRNFLAGEALYDPVFSQYGPVPYVYHLVLTLGGSIELTHMFGRMLTAIHWVVCAGAAGWIGAHLVTNHRGLVACFATLITFNFLWQMVAEPSHPGSMIAAIVAVSTALGLHAIQKGQPRQLAVIIGVTAAGLVLTKINVGAFFIAGAGAFALWSTNWRERWQRPAMGLAVVGLLALPWLLMAGNLDQPRIFGFALKASLAAAGVLWVFPMMPQEKTTAPVVWWYAIGAFAITSGIVISVVLLRGTSVSALISAVVLDPLRQPGNFVVPPRNAPATWVIAAMAWSITAFAGWSLRKNGALNQIAKRLVIGFRLLLLIAFIRYAPQWASPWGAFGYLDVCLPLLPIWLVPLRSSFSATRIGLLWLSLISLPQVLHAYPVVGSQTGWGAFLSLAVVAFGLADLLAMPWPRRLRSGHYAVAGLALGAAVFQTAKLSKIGFDRYTTSQPLGLPGAEDIRVADITRITLRSLVQNAAVHADVLVTRPGMYSLNIWSGIPTPTFRNSTHWFWLLNENQQQEIVDKLEATPRSLLIGCTPLEEFLDEINVPVAGRLQDYLNENFAYRFSIHDFRMFQPAGARLAPIGYAILYPDGRDLGSASADAIIPFRVAVIMTGTPRSVDIMQFSETSAAEVVATDFTELRFSPILRSGAVVGTPTPLALTQELSGLFILEGTITGQVAREGLQNRGLVIRDAQGEILAEALF